MEAISPLFAAYVICSKLSKSKHKALSLLNHIEPDRLRRKTVQETSEYYAQCF